MFVHLINLNNLKLKYEKNPKKHLQRCFYFWIMFKNVKDLRIPEEAR